MTATRRAAIALAAGAAYAIAAPPLRIWPAVFVSMWLFALATDGASLAGGAFAGWLVGASAGFGGFYWIARTVTEFTGLPLPAGVALYVLMAAVSGVTLGVVGALAAGLADVIGHPVALALGLFVAERWMPAVFPWQLAAPIVFAPWLRQCADLVGVSGLGALMLGALATVARPASRRLGNARPAMPTWAYALAAGIVVVAWGYGGVRTRFVRAAMAAAPRVRVALLQPNIPPTIRWEDEFHGQILRGLQLQTYDAFQQHAALVVWSEGAYPYPLQHRAGIDGEGMQPVYPWRASAPIVFGAVSRDAEGRRYNAVFVRQMNGRISAPVAKRVLVPFGEYIPIVHGIPWVRRAFVRAEGLTVGTVPEILDTNSGLRLSVLNCFEDTIAWVAAEASDADLLINMTNDAWFGTGAAPWQHLMLAQWRPIETGRELLRSVNTGVTCEVNPLGEIENSLPIWQRGALLVNARRMSLHTLAPTFIRHAPTIALIVLALASLERVRRRLWRKRKTLAEPDADL